MPHIDHILIKHALYGCVISLTLGFTGLIQVLYTTIKSLSYDQTSYFGVSYVASAFLHVIKNLKYHFVRSWHSHTYTHKERDSHS